jgi:hypothetical protein
MSATIVWILLALVPKQDDGELTNQRIYMGAFDSEASCHKAAAQNQHRDGVLWICRAVTVLSGNKVRARSRVYAAAR